MTWRKSTKCNGADACIEVEERGGLVYARNSGNVSHPIIATPIEWLAFIEGVKAGDFDDVIPERLEASPALG